MSAIFLIGSPGSGKAAVLAELTDRGFLVADVAQGAATRAGLTLRDFYLLQDAQQQESWLDQTLSDYLEDIANEPSGNFALSISSQALAKNAEKLKKSGGYVVHLYGQLSTLVTRNGLIGAPNNAIMPRREFRLLLGESLPKFQELADLEIDTTNLLAPEVAQRILSAVSQF